MNLFPRDSNPGGRRNAYPSRPALGYNPYTIYQNEQLVTELRRIDKTLPVEVDASHSGFESLYSFIYDLNLYQIGYYFQFLFQSLDHDRVLAATPSNIITTRQELRNILENALEQIQRASTDSWQQVYDFYGLPQNNNVDIDVLFSRNVIVSLSNASGGCVSEYEGVRVFRINSMTTLKGKKCKSRDNNCGLQALRTFNSCIFARTNISIYST